MDSGACASITFGILNFRLFHLLSSPGVSRRCGLGQTRQDAYWGAPIPQSLVEQAKKNRP